MVVSNSSVTTDGKATVVLTGKSTPSEDMRDLDTPSDTVLSSLLRILAITTIAHTNSLTLTEDLDKLIWLELSTTTIRELTGESMLTAMVLTPSRPLKEVATKITSGWTVRLLEVMLLWAPILVMDSLVLDGMLRDYLAVASPSSALVPMFKLPMCSWMVTLLMELSDLPPIPEVITLEPNGESNTFN